ncbi:MAG: efflux RND transporter periplasmic adaptor subunit [Rhodomicrobium sp.]
MSQSDSSELANTPRPFDGYDDVAENVTEPHAHPVIPDGYKPGTGSRLTVLAGVLAIALVGGFVLVSVIKAQNRAELASATEAKVQEAPAVEVITVKLAPPTEALRLPAATRGWYTSTIYARVSGYLTRWYVDIGDRVKKYQTLAEIDTPELDAQLEAAKAQLKASEAELKVKETEAEFARTTYERWSGSAKGVVSEQEREDKKASNAGAEAKLNAQKARVNLDKSNVDRLTYLTQFKQVAAPFEGVITDRRIDIGDLVTAGSTSNTSPLFGISQYDRIRVFASVPQVAAGDVGVGTAARITAAEFPDRVFEGKVTRTSESIDPQSRTLRVEVDLPNPDLKLLPGMYVKVEFDFKSNAKVQIPASALLFRAEGPQVAVVQPDSTVKFKDVQIGRDNGNTVEITSGLAEGDTVVLNINNQIQDGSKVTVKDNKKIAAK